jgi:hypothetical protein
VRLRFLHLPEYPPLRDFEVVFSATAPWSELAQSVAPSACAIHFVVGLNGSGKSHLLRAIAKIFLGLADGQAPGFPCSVIYELGKVGDSGFRSIVFDNPGAEHQASLWVGEGWRFPLDTASATYGRALELLRRAGRGSVTFGEARFDARIPVGTFPQSASYALPRALLAYTSGAQAPWEQLWHAPVEASALDVLSHSAAYDANQERPAGWTLEEEARVMREEGALSNIFSAGGQTVGASVGPVESFLRPVLLEGTKLTAALLAVALQDFHDRLNNVSRNPELTRLFGKAGWNSLVGIRLQLDLRQALRGPRALLLRLHDLLLAAGEVLRDPHPSGGWRSIYIDVEGALVQQAEFLNPLRFEGVQTQGHALHALLGEPGAPSFERFGTLLTWMQYGLVRDLELFIRRTDKDDDAGDLDDASDVGVLRLSEFSDGERMVLSRWALFHLLAGQDDALLLLDEPETHFNDVWKREIVGIVESAMGASFSAALIATHSAIVLSDVFDEEVVMVRKSSGSSFVAPVTDRTFATDPSALMMTVFDAEDSIGERAKSRIEQFMLAVGTKEQPTQQDVVRLTRIVARLGTGFYRTQLLALLHRWRDTMGSVEISPEPPPSESAGLDQDLRRLLASSAEKGDTGPNA